jgi:hypothetical protein
MKRIITFFIFFMFLSFYSHAQCPKAGYTHWKNGRVEAHADYGFLVNKTKAITVKVTLEPHADNISGEHIVPVATVAQVNKGHQNWTDSIHYQQWIVGVIWENYKLQKINGRWVAEFYFTKNTTDDRWISVRLDYSLSNSFKCFKTKTKIIYTGTCDWICLVFRSDIRIDTKRNIIQCFKRGDNCSGFKGYDSHSACSESDAHRIGKDLTLSTQKTYEVIKRAGT